MISILILVSIEQSANNLSLSFYIFDRNESEYLMNSIFQF